MFKKDVTAEHVAETLHSYAIKVLCTAADHCKWHWRNRLEEDINNLLDDADNHDHINEQDKLKWNWEVTYFIYSIVAIIADSFIATQKMGKTEVVIDLYLNNFVNQFNFPDDNIRLFYHKE